MSIFNQLADLIKSAVTPASRPVDPTVPTPTPDPFKAKGLIQTGPNTYSTQRAIDARQVAPQATPTALPPQLARAILPQQQQSNIQGYSNGSVPPEYAQLVTKYAQQNGIDPALLSALIFNESGFNPKAFNQNVNQQGIKSSDRGIAQISNVSYPDITDAQAYDPNFAINWAAQRLRDNISKFGDVNKGLAAYNVGPGGASIQGVNPYGGGPRGQTYINRVARNMSADAVSKLGLKVGQPIWRDINGNPIQQP